MQIGALDAHYCHTEISLCMSNKTSKKEGVNGNTRLNTGDQHIMGCIVGRLTKVPRNCFHTKFALEIREERCERHTSQLKGQRFDHMFFQVSIKSSDDVKVRFTIMKDHKKIVMLVESKKKITLRLTMRVGPIHFNLVHNGWQNTVSKARVSHGDKQTQQTQIQQGT